MTEFPLNWRRALFALALALGIVNAWAQGPRPAAPAAARGGDYIVAVVNQELVTAAELQGRIVRIRDEATRAGMQLPPPGALRQQALESLIDERVLITAARDSGIRIDDSEIDRAVQAVARQNQLTLPQLQERLRQDGLDMARFRTNLRDQLLVERMREREVVSRIKVTDAEIDAVLAARRAASGASGEVNIAQILVTVPEGASDAVIAERRARAEAALARVKGGEDFAAVARDISEDANRANGGEIGLRPTDRLPDVFVQTVQPLAPGQVAPQLLRSGAGFHVLKLVERRSAGLTMQQTHARHILLRPSAELTPEAAATRLAQLKRTIADGGSFEQAARANSQDASATAGGDLGWTSPGQLVGEFEEAMNALPIGGISDPVTTRFGVHLIQVVERRSVPVDPRQLREQARNIVREQKFEDAYMEWIRDLRGRAYIELRDAPQ
ncbi:peptidylprolyl isomerase [Piscinibacter koreensis]|uniref:Chaperone SurA n=1 Tax=Piscinibacter koreensis TaxID=2742824 RepID=A0A7Y6NJW7_9BURK|nr:peptidylprolyl isomerase [Schlegelella koreensis]NUZ04512.1 peptidylprolyl isomerase [Schlegelella koreensis]